MDPLKFEDIFPIENGDVHCYVSLPEGIGCRFYQAYKATPWHAHATYIKFLKTKMVFDGPQGRQVHRSG